MERGSAGFSTGPSLHAGAVHYHVALQASQSFRFAPYKRALLHRHRLASHWSCSHDGYWSTVRYGYIPSPKKAQSELDPTPLAWAQSGEHHPLFDAAQEPSTACALRRRREQKVRDASASARTEPRATELDLYPVIVQQGFRNTPDDPWAAKRLIKHLQDARAGGLGQGSTPD